MVVRANTFGIRKNEVMGLLGPNGAGKSTTFSMLTLDTQRSMGDAIIMGTPISEFNPRNQNYQMGLCSQENLLWDRLTVDEHLDMIGAIKGLSKEDIVFQRELIK